MKRCTCNLTCRPRCLRPGMFLEPEPGRNGNGRNAIFEKRLERSERGTQSHGTRSTVPPVPIFSPERVPKHPCLRHDKELTWIFPRSKSSRMAGIRFHPSISMAVREVNRRTVLSRLANWEFCSRLK